MSRSNCRRWTSAALVGIIGAAAAAATAQTSSPPPAPSPASSPSSLPPDNTPSLKIGTVIYANYTFTARPTTIDADGNTIHQNLFEVGRAYINVTGNLHHLVSFRVTPDIASRLATTVSKGAVGETASTNYDGNLVFRLKYAFAQLNLDDWLPKGSWLRVGQQQTPFLDFMENIYRYRFQGTVAEEREGFLTSSDNGVSARFAFPGNYGDVHGGVYNGDGYTRGEANDQKAFQIRATLRPAPNRPVFKGLRLTAFLDADRYIKSAPRNRFVTSAVFEHPRVNLGVNYITATDQTSVRAPRVDSGGYSAWIQPRTKMGLEGVLRFDNVNPNKLRDARKKRSLMGVSYWLKTQGSAQVALFASIEKVNYDALLARANERRLAMSFLFTY